MFTYNYAGGALDNHEIRIEISRWLTPRRDALGMCRSHTSRHHADQPAGGGQKANVAASVHRFNARAGTTTEVAS